MMFFNWFCSLFIVFAVSLWCFVVWFATIEKAEVPPPAGKGMNHKWGRGAVSAPKKTWAKIGHSPQESMLPFRFSLCTLFPYPCSIFAIPFHKHSLDLLMPTVHKSTPFTLFHVALNRRLFGVGNNVKSLVIVVILNLKFSRRVA